MSEYPEGVPGEFQGEFRGSSGEFRGVPQFFCYFPLCSALEKRRLKGVPVATTPSVYNIKRGSKGSRRLPRTHTRIPGLDPRAPLNPHTDLWPGAPF